MLTDPEGGVLLAGSAAMTPDLAEGLIERRAAADRQPDAARGRRGAADPRPLHHPLPHRRQLLHHLRREPDPDLGDPRLARHPGRRGAAHLLRERAAGVLRPAGGAAAAAEHPRARRRARDRRAGAELPELGDLRLRLQAALLPRARAVGGRDGHALRDHRRRGAGRGRVPPPLRERRVRCLRACSRSTTEAAASGGGVPGARVVRPAAGLRRRLRHQPGQRRHVPGRVRLLRRRPADEHPAAYDAPGRTTSCSSTPSLSRACARARTPATCRSSSPSSPIGGWSIRPARPDAWDFTCSRSA